MSFTNVLLIMYIVFSIIGIALLAVFKVLYWRGENDACWGFLASSITAFILETMSAVILFGISALGHEIFVLAIAAMIATAAEEFC